LERETKLPSPQKKRSKKKPRAGKESKTIPNQSIQRSSGTESRDEFTEKLSSMRSELSALSFRVGRLPEHISRLDNDITGIPERIQRIQKNRINHLSSIDQTGGELSETWGHIRETVERNSLEQRDNLLRRQKILESSIQNTDSITELAKLGYQLSELGRNLDTAENSISGQLGGYQSKYAQIDRELKAAEFTINNLEGSSIEWKQGEHPILAVEVKDLTKDDNGVLTLSNQRVLFEKVSEEVLKRNLLFATEKKTVHTVTLDEPIGSIDVIEKGRVGFFKGAGLFVRFKAHLGLKELKIDTSGNEDTRIIQAYNYIVSGEAEQDIGLGDESEPNGLVACPTCSAPYQEEILLGQTSVKCIYCGTVIKV
jgi:hypothetical protein